MNRKQITLSIVLGMTVANGVFASNPISENKDFDINSITYIEEELEIDLGFDPADYLPEGFDPYKIYVDLNGFEFIEEDTVEIADGAKYLPQGFNAYANPQEVAGFNYIDEKDTIVLDFDTKEHLPEGFDPYIHTKK